MTVTKVELTQWDGGESIDSVDYRLTYAVWTNDRMDGPLIVRSATGVHYGDAYASGNEVDTRARALSITQRQISTGDFNHWEVDITYGAIEKTENPLDEPVKESVNWEAVNRRVNRFANGDPIYNTAYDLPEGGVEFEDNTPTATYTLNQASFPFALAQAVRNGINSTPWKGFAAYTVKLKSMQSERMYDKRIGVYYAVSYSFEINPDTWILRYESMGVNELYTAAGGLIKKRRITNLGMSINTPVYLDSAGHRILLNGSGVPASAPVILSGYLNPQFNFNTLFPFL